MRKMKKMLALLLAAVMVMGMSVIIYADTSTPSITIVPNNEAGSTDSLAINYTYYRILEASIDTDPTVTQADGTTPSDGKGVVAYYVTTLDRATELKDHTGGLFTVTKVDGQDKWYVEAANKDTITAEAIISAFESEAFVLSKFPTGTFDKTATETQAESGTLPAGYYYIQSSLGTKAALETLTAVTINEKNTYPSLTKSDDKEFAPIDGTVTYTMTVSIPESVANKSITISDTITNGLTLNTAVTVEGAITDPAYTTGTFVQSGTIAAQAAVVDDPATTDVNESKPAVKAATIYTLEIPGNVVFANKRYVANPRIMHLKKKEILFCRIKILNHTKRFDELYRLIRADQNKYFLLEFGFFRLLDVYCRKRLGKYIDIERADKSYLFHQIADYSFDRMISHVKEHLSDYNSLLDIPENSIFSDNFPLKDILSQFKDYVDYDKKLCYGIIDDVYIFKYDNCGKVNYKTTDFFKVICFSGTCDIITAYPIDNVKHLPYTDLSSFVKNDDDIQMIMRPSARDRFNKRFNRK